VIDTDVRTANDELVRSGYDAFAAGDLAAVEALFRPDAVWHAQRLGLLSGDHTGWPAIAEFFGRTMQLTAGSFSVTIEDVLTNDTGAAAVVRSRGERDGRRLDDRQVHLFRLDGVRVAEVWQFPGEGADAFWA
jgi:ketosteroid isomerase-like protein